MKEEFTNTGCYLAFSDEGITFKGDEFHNGNYKNRFFPYGSITKISFSIGVLSVVGQKNGENKAFNFAVSGRDTKKRIKELMAFAKTKMATAEKADVVEFDTESVKEDIADIKKQEELSHEHRMKCNVCGTVFCYTDKDIKDNLSNATLAALSGVGTIAAAVGGTRLDMYGQSNMAHQNASKIIDYTRCPSCHSKDIVPLENDESANAEQINNTSVVSPAEEVKKLKELLDMGAITQEEFDAKKKELLGL